MTRLLVLTIVAVSWYICITHINITPTNTENILRYLTTGYLKILNLNLLCILYTAVARSHSKTCVYFMLWQYSSHVGLTWLSFLQLSSDFILTHTMSANIIAYILVVTAPTQPQLNSKVGFDTKMTLDHHHHLLLHPHKLNVSNISAVTDPMSTKL